MPDSSTEPLLVSTCTSPSMLLTSTRLLSLSTSTSRWRGTSMRYVTRHHIEPNTGHDPRSSSVASTTSWLKPVRRSPSDTSASTLISSASVPTIVTEPVALSTRSPVMSAAGTVKRSVRSSWASSSTTLSVPQPRPASTNNEPNTTHRDRPRGGRVTTSGTGAVCARSSSTAVIISTPHPLQHRQHAAMIVSVGRQVELRQDAADVLLYRLVRHHE